MNQIKVTAPPTGFNPLSATNAELKQYNIPARPTDPTQLARWKNAVGKMHWFTPTFKNGLVQNRPNLKKSGKAPAVKNGLSYLSGNWSGVVDSETESTVAGYWQEPNATVNTAYTSDYESSWVGLGGFNSDVLIQDGTETDVSSDGTPTNDICLEIIGSNADTGSEVVINGFPNSPGDTFYSQISFSTDPETGDGTAQFFIEDVSNGYATSFEVTGIQDYEGVTSSAEWISERPTVSMDSPYYLTNYGSVPFDAGDGTSGTAYAISSLNPNIDYLYMDDNSGNIMSEPTSLDTTGDFSTVWESYGDGN